MARAKIGDWKNIKDMVVSKVHLFIIDENYNDKEYFFKNCKISNWI